MAGQTSYSLGPAAPAFAGQKTGSGPSQVGTYVNDEGADLPAGVFVWLSAGGEAKLPTTATQQLAGVVLNQFARDPNDLTGTNAIGDGDSMAVLEEGDVWVLAEEAMAVTDKVYVRYDTGAGGSQKGAIRNDADTSTARRVTGARVRFATTAAGPCLISFSAAADASNL